MTVCRNSHGEILQVWLSKFHGTDSIKGEARAARLACVLAEELKESEVWLEGDVQTLVQQISDSSVVPDWNIEVEVMSIRALLRANPLWNISWTAREGNFMAHLLARRAQQSVDLDSVLSGDEFLRTLSVVTTLLFPAESLLLGDSMLRRKKKLRVKFSSHLLTV